MRQISILWKWVNLPALALLAGCAQEPPPPVPIQPVTIVASTFCKTMREILPPDGKPSWDVTDTARSIEDDLKLERAVDSQCKKRSANRSTTR
jgi:hypothetical protein